MMFEIETTTTFETFNAILFFGVWWAAWTFIFFEALKKFFDRVIG